MDERRPRKRQTTRFSRSARNKRIVERVRAGLGYDEVAREEGLTEKRVRQIVKEALEGREALASGVHAHLQVDRASRALRVTGEARSTPLSRSGEGSGLRDRWKSSTAIWRSRASPPCAGRRW
ncbi:MAG: hypothetical protein JO288_01960 [Hyphomicrobiales bacterium]|nr:hypothetical protein [Hyphomicrobiales bacterium]